MIPEDDFVWHSIVNTLLVHQRSVLARFAGFPIATRATDLIRLESPARLAHLPHTKKKTKHTRLRYDTEDGRLGRWRRSSASIFSDNIEHQTPLCPTAPGPCQTYPPSPMHTRYLLSPTT